MIRNILMAVAIAGAAVALSPAHAADKTRSTSAKIENALKDVEDNQSLQQFEIQSSAQQKTSENVRSQAEKRLEQQRRDLIRNWGG